MSTPAGDPISELTRGAADASGRLAMVDESLAESVQEGLQRVELLLHDSVHNELDFAKRTSLHLVEAGGKRFRPLFTLLAGHFGDPGADDVIKSAAIIEMVHLATLYHDDVMDEATMRRGATSANARWDNSVAILTGDLLFAQASRLVSDLGTDAARHMATTFEALVTGQMRETAGPGNGADAVDYYLRVIQEKTGSLIATAGCFGAWFAGAADEHVRALDRVGRLIGTAFQISDDIIDIASPAMESGKTPGTDLREGVRTLPMLYVLADPDADPRLHELLSRPLTEDDEVDAALRLLRDSKGLGRARDKLDDFAVDARKEVARLPAGVARDALSSVVDYVVERTR